MWLITPDQVKCVQENWSRRSLAFWCKSSQTWVPQNHPRACENTACWALSPEFLFSRFAGGPEFPGDTDAAVRGPHWETLFQKKEQMAGKYS